MFNQLTNTGISDAMQTDDHLTAIDIGKRASFLPSSFKGSPRNFYQRYLDAMAIVRVYGAPNLFITFTCNSNWPEIQGKCGLTAETYPEKFSHNIFLQMNFWMARQRTKGLTWSRACLSRN